MKKAPIKKDLKDSSLLFKIEGGRAELSKFTYDEEYFKLLNQRVNRFIKSINSYSSSRGKPFEVNVYFTSLKED